jgi:hypothetical protein
MYLRFRWWLLWIALAAVPPVLAQGEVRCKVHDPELQGGYAGGCKDGFAEGVGEATGLAHYKGEFKAGRKHGRGVKQWPSGNRYEGDFVTDTRDGKGSYTWGRGTQWAGERYTGDYRNDRRHGHGIYEWPDGERYTGPWENDAITGRPSARMYARSRAYMEHAAAVAIPGIKVCKSVTLGITTQDWIRGTVTEVTGQQITVRIDAAGNAQHLASGQPLKAGDVIRDALLFWTPCL